MKPIIFFDLDGVLADLVTGALRHHKATLPIMEVQYDFCTQLGFSGHTDPAFWDPLGFNFWSTLGIYPDGLCLLRAAESLVGPDSIGFLTAPTKSRGCVDGKLAWVEKHFPDYVDRVFTGKSKEMFASPDKILVDDSDLNIEKFSGRGGRGVLVPRPWNRNRAGCNKDGSFNVVVAHSELQYVVRLIDCLPALKV
jgi:5'(3')-deoxyribonucleotidase